MIVVDVLNEDTDLDEVRALSEMAQSRMDAVEREAFRDVWRALFEFESVDEAVAFAESEVDFSVLEHEVSDVSELEEAFEGFEQMREHPIFDFEAFRTLVRYCHGFDVSFEEAVDARESAPSKMEVTVSIPCSEIVDGE